MRSESGKRLWKECRKNDPRNKKGFIITVKFGQKNITYNPKCTENDKYSSLERVIETLRNHPDLENADKVVEAFIEAVEVAEKYIRK